MRAGGDNGIGGVVGEAQSLRFVAAEEAGEPGARFAHQLLRAGASAGPGAAAPRAFPPFFVETDGEFKNLVGFRVSGGAVAQIYISFITRK